MATFADGIQREIPEFLTAALEAKQIVTSTRRVHVTLKSPTGALIVVKDRLDRNKLPLISLFLSLTQMCQIMPREPEQVEPMRQVTTVQFESSKRSELLIRVMMGKTGLFHGREEYFPIPQVLVKLAHQLADGTVDKSELEKYRNEFCKDMGLPTKS